MVKNVYAIWDKSAETIVGGVHLFPNDTAAIRFFGDIAIDSQTFVSRHIDDHDLLILGKLDEEDAVLIPVDLGDKVVITGAAWKSSQTPAEAK